MISPGERGGGGGYYETSLNGAIAESSIEANAAKTEVRSIPFLKEDVELFKRFR